jgi:hypothetical protein
MNYSCELCNYKTDRAYDMKVHLRCTKHLKRECITSKENNGLMKYDHITQNVCHTDKVISETGNIPIIEEDICKETEKKPAKIYKCQFCKLILSCSSSLSKHKKRCKFNKENNNDKIVLSVEEFNNLKCYMTEKMDEKMDKIVDKLLNVIETKQSVKQETIQPFTPVNINVMNASMNTDMSTNLNMSNTNIVNTSNISNVMKYVNQNYTKAEPLEMLESVQAKKLVTDKTTKDHKVEEFLIYYYDKRSFAMFIGDIIVNAYKKDNPEEQQIWASDVERLTFIIRRALKENELLWMKDLKGVTITKYLIIPILNEVYIIIDEYLEHCSTIMKAKDTSFDDMDKYYKYSVICKKILSDIGNKLFHDPILKYIISKFQLYSDNKQITIKGAS